MMKYKILIIYFSSLIIFLFCLLFVISFFLKIHTNYNKEIEVPNLLGKPVSVCHNELTILKLNYKLLNIGAYNPNFSNGSVVTQNPLPGDKVKEGRKIYLTINPDNIPKTIFPDISDKPFRHAVALLKSYKLKVGSIFFQNDIARNVVLNSKYNGVPLSEIDSLLIFSSVDLYIGSGEPRNRVEIKIPDLHGVLLPNIEDMIKQNFLNFGKIYFDELITDTLNSFVYQQSIIPSNFVLEFSSEIQSPFIDIWVTNDSSKLFN